MRSPAYCAACCNVQLYLHHDFLRVQQRAHMVCAAYNRSPHCPVPHLRLPLARPFLGLRCAARAPEQARATAQAAPCVFIRQLGTCILACYREVPPCYAAGLKSRCCGGFRRHPRLVSDAGSSWGDSEGDPLTRVPTTLSRIAITCSRLPSTHTSAPRRRCPPACASFCTFAAEASSS
jgi:hypothetical protein